MANQILSSDGPVDEDNSGASIRTDHWIFCSSGARPLYLENVVRSLALPAGETIQYRYEKKIVSDIFWDAIDGKKIPSGQPMVGDTAYLGYLDNRKPGEDPVVYPVREARIVEASRRGTTVIVRLELQRFVDWTDNCDCSRIAQEVVKTAEGELPRWEKRASLSGGDNEWAMTGNWIAQATAFPNEYLEPYSAKSGGHLAAFESAVDAITKGADFATGNWMFANILSVRDISQRRFWKALRDFREFWFGCNARSTEGLVKNGGLIAGRAYEITLYHYQGPDSTHDVLEEFLFELSSENEDIVFITESVRPIQARYDEVKFTFRIKDDARTSPTYVNIAIYRKVCGKRVFSLRSRLAVKIRSNFWRRAFFGALMGFGLLGTQLPALTSATADVSPWAIVGSIAFALLAGMAAAFQFRTKPA